MMIARTLIPAAVLLSVATLASAPPAADGALHLKLDKSAPEADATVSSVSEVRLWFSQKPDAQGTSIRVIDASGEPVPTSDLAADSGDAKVQYVTLAAPLAAGAYTVSWRAMSPDGHVVRGDYAFAVAAQ